MNVVAIIATVFFFVLCIVLVGMLPLIILALKGKSPDGANRGEMEAERQQVQTIYANLEKMAKRLEALETILVDEVGRRESGEGVDK